MSNNNVSGKGLSLYERFLQAEKNCEDSDQSIPENLKMRLYGLKKQAREGDCKMPMPPR
jgi:acyl-CoA-binding protein